MMSVLFALILAASSLFQARATPAQCVSTLEGTRGSLVSLGTPIHSSEIGRLGEELSAQNRVDCRALTDIPGAYVCVASNFHLLRGLTGRATHFMTDPPRGEVISTNSRAYRDQSYSGHDFPGRVLDAFYLAIDESCREGGPCMTRLEADLRYLIETDLKLRGLKSFSLIAASVDYEFMWTVNHELYHSRFYSDSKYRKVVKKFWNEKLTAKERAAFAKTLARVYDVEGAAGEFMLINEWQAYTLQWGSWMGWYMWRDLAEALPHADLRDHRVEELREALGDLLPSAPSLSELNTRLGVRLSSPLRYSPVDRLGEF